MQESKNKNARLNPLKTLYGRFLMALIIVGIIPFALIGFVIVNIETRALNDQSTRELTGLARGLAGELDTFLSELLRDSQAIASLPQITGMDLPTQEAILKDLFVHYSNYGQFAIVDLTGQIQTTARPQELVNITRVTSFQNASTLGQQSWVIEPGLFSETLVLHMHTPIRNANREVVGILGSPVPLGTPANILAEIDIGGQGEAFVLDEKGLVLLHPDAAVREARRSYAEWVALPGEGSVLGVGTARYTVDDVPRLAGFAPIPNFGWTVVVDRPEAEVLAPAVATRNLAIAGLMFSLFLSFIIAIFLARGLTRPVRNLANAAQALGEGNADAPLSRQNSGVAEIGTLVGAFSSMREAVIDREENLKQSEARTRALVNAIPDILFRVRKDGTIIDTTVPTAANTELHTPHFIKTNFYQLVYSLGTQPLAQRFVTGFEEAVKTGAIQVVESQLSINGRLTDFEARYVVSGDDEVLIMLRDTTERKQAEAAIRKHLSALEAANDGMAILDHNQIYTYVNDAHVKLHGYTHADEMIGKPWRTAYSPQEYNRLTKEVLPTVMEKGVWHGESVGKRRDNSIYFQEMSLTLIETGEFVCVVRDITERKESEEALRQAQKLESLGVLAGGIAHDFNNLLTGMLGHASIVQATLPEESEGSEQLERLMQSAETAADLTRQLLAYAGKGQFAIRPINLNKLIQENVGLIETAIPLRTELEFDLQEELPLIEADRSQIQQVVMNLVINAAESLGEDGGRVCIHTELQDITPEMSQQMETDLIGADKLRPGNYVVLNISDTGQGMTESTIKRIFDPFFTTKATGHGLGLSATLGIIRTHNGGVQVQSTPGEGSTFRILFPASAQTEGRQAVTSFKPPKMSGRVLVIDDEASVRRVAQDMLRVLGIDVILASGGQEGISFYHEHQDKIDLVLLDMKMPGMDGEETFRHLLAINPNVQVILATGYSETEDLTTFVDHPSVDFLRKPFALSALASRIQAILNDVPLKTE
ncbi:MAG: cache domain-containing protein [Chloroflexota bacterium]